MQYFHRKDRGCLSIIIKNYWIVKPSVCQLVWGVLFWSEVWSHGVVTSAQEWEILAWECRPLEWEELWAAQDPHQPAGDKQRHTGAVCGLSWHWGVHTPLPSWQEVCVCVCVFWLYIKVASKLVSQRPQLPPHFRIKDKCTAYLILLSVVEHLLHKIFVKQRGSVTYTLTICSTKELIYACDAECSSNWEGSSGWCSTLPTLTQMFAMRHCLLYRNSWYITGKSARLMALLLHLANYIISFRVDA